MADEREGSSNTAIIAIIVIVLIAAVGLFIAYQGGYLGGTAPTEQQKIDIDIKAPSPAPPPAPSAPAPAPAPVAP